jgi:hypothetical protein
VSPRRRAKLRPDSLVTFVAASSSVMPGNMMCGSVYSLLTQSRPWSLVFGAHGQRHIADEVAVIAELTGAGFRPRAPVGSNGLAPGDDRSPRPNSPAARRCSPSARGGFRRRSWSVLFEGERRGHLCGRRLATRPPMPARAATLVRPSKAARRERTCVEQDRHRCANRISSGRPPVLAEGMAYRARAASGRGQVCYGFVTGRDRCGYPTRVMPGPSGRMSAFAGRGRTALSERELGRRPRG